MLATVWRACEKRRGSAQSRSIERSGLLRANFNGIAIQLLLNCPNNALGSHLECRSGTLFSARFQNVCAPTGNCLCKSSNLRRVCLRCRFSHHFKLVSANTLNTFSAFLNEEWQRQFEGG